MPENLNDLTKAVFEQLDTPTEESLKRIEELVKASDGLEQLPKLCINFTKTRKVIDNKSGKCNQFELGFLSYAIYKKNLDAFEYLLRLEINGLGINVGHPSPLWMAVYVGLPQAYIEQMIDFGAEVNYTYKGKLEIKNTYKTNSQISKQEEYRDSYGYTRTRVINVQNDFSELQASILTLSLLLKNLSVIRLFLLHGAQFTDQDKNFVSKHQTELTIDEGETSTPENLTNVFLSSGYISESVSAYIKKNNLKFAARAAQAIDKSPHFFLAFIALKIKKINEHIFELDKLPIRQLLEMFWHIISIDIKQYTSLANLYHDEVLIHLIGHDCSPATGSKLFENNTIKMEWIKKHCTEQSWTQTSLMMKGSNSKEGGTQIIKAQIESFDNVDGINSRSVSVNSQGSITFGKLEELQGPCQSNDKNDSQSKAVGGFGSADKSAPPTANIGTQFCKHYKDKGSCRYGEQCKFKHDIKGERVHK